MIKKLLRNRTKKYCWFIKGQPFPKEMEKIHTLMLRWRNGMTTRNRRTQNIAKAREMSFDMEREAWRSR